MVLAAPNTVLCSWLWMVMLAGLWLCIEESKKLSPTVEVCGDDYPAADVAFGEVEFPDGAAYGAVRVSGG